MAEKETKKQKRAILASALALFTAASVAVSGVSDSPTALLEGTGTDSKLRSVISTQADDDEDAEELDENEDEQKKRGGVRASLRQRILSLPMIVRLLVVLPMWLLGTRVTLLGSVLFSAASPLLARILSAVLLVVVLFGAFLLSAKAIFPDLPIKKLLNRRTVPGLLIGAAILIAADLLLGFFWPDYSEFKSVLAAVGVLAVLSALVLSFVYREQKRRQKTPLGEGEQGGNDGKLTFVDREGRTFSIKKPLPYKKRGDVP